MEVYETEEQQVEAVKKWWKENGTSLIIGAVIGLSAIGGWKYYQSEEEVHRIQASADLLLVPSRFEPCGLTQLYALRYGTLPVVRHTGGLADTVTNASRGGLGTGFVFTNPTADGLLDAVLRAITAYQQPGVWRKMQRRAMKQDFSWDASARRYQALYRELARAGKKES